MGIDYNIKRSPAYVLTLMAVLALLFLTVFLLDSRRDQKLPARIFSAAADDIIMVVDGAPYRLKASSTDTLRSMVFTRAGSRLRFSGTSYISFGDTIYDMAISKGVMSATFIHVPGKGNYMIEGNLRDMLEWEEAAGE